MTYTPTRRALLGAVAACALAAPGSAEAATAKNVMLFITDGASWGTFDMASYWQHGKKNGQPYADFNTKLGMTTEPYSDPQRVYDPQKAWDTTRTDASDGQPFEGYKYIDSGATDSAAAGTVLATGQKTRNGRIDFDKDDQPLPFITQDMKDAGKATGVVSSVMFSHATPATFGAQNISRNNRQEIADQMINDGVVDVIMGGGNPMFDDDGKARDTPGFGSISEADWAALNGPDAPMTLIQTRADFEALADGSKQIDGRVIGLPQVGGTLQANRDPFTTPTDPNAPGSPNLGFDEGHVLIETVPTLETMTRGALNHLGKDEDGLFMMVEGGAVDWMAHANATGRIIEEQVDFDNAVGAGIEWVEVNSNWDETLMIVLTDHGNGMPMGPDSDEIAFQAIENNGQGVLPGVQWHNGGHTTENTLFWAEGAGSELFMQEIVGTDMALSEVLGFNDGSYIDNSSVYGVMKTAALGASVAPVPLPAAGWLLVAGLGGLLALRRKRAA